MSAATFHSELKRSMSRRGVTLRQLSESSGVGLSTIKAARAGVRLPLQEVVAQLADALDWPSLATIATAARTTVCVTCGATFVRYRSGPRNVHCPGRCAKAAHSRRQRGYKQRDSEETRRLTTVRLRRMEAAVASFCRGCEPAGICMTASCALRSVSPLPLAAIGLRRVS